jgi:hypothetical protein
MAALSPWSTRRGGGGGWNGVAGRAARAASRWQPGPAAAGPAIRREPLSTRGGSREARRKEEGMRRNVIGSSLLVAFAALAIMAGGLAFAQEQTGAIEGVVNDKDGAALPGVTVEAAGPLGAVVAVTDINGVYRFAALRSGVYRMTAKLDGFVTAEVPGVDVKLGTTLKVNFTMQPGTFEDTITVAADTVAIDVTKTQTATSISREEIQLLPRGRDFTDVVALAAGASNESQAGGISIDGSSGSENRFIIDGIDTTNPQTGVNAIPMRADFIEEVQVKSAGYAAEFGGSTGGVINAISKSGGNEFHGGVLAQYADSDWNGKVRPTLETNLLNTNQAQYTVYDVDDETRVDPGFYIGGPIFRNKLWFFGSYQPGITDTDRTVTFVNAANPNGFYTDTYNQKVTVDYAAVNFTANFGSVLFKIGGNISPYEQERSLPGVQGRSTQTSQEAYVRGREGERETYSASLDFVPSESFVISAKLGLYHTDVLDTGVKFPGLIHNYSTSSVNPATIPGFDPASIHTPGWTSDTLITDATATNLYEREYYGLDASWFFSAAGDHTLKFGAQVENISNDVASGYNADRILYYWGRTYTMTTGERRTGQFGYFRLLNISTFGSVESRNDALFIQDSWNVSRNFTINFGVRAEHERVPNYGATGPEYAIEFDYADKTAPRFGFAWDVNGDQKWKVYGSYGTYFDVMKYEMPRGSFGGDKWVDFFFTADSSNIQLNTTTGCRVGNNTYLDRPDCGMGTFIEAVDRRFNSADPEDPTIEPNLKPMEQWEAQIGAEHQLTSTVKVGARYVHKELVRTIEDVGILIPGIGEVYYIANPGEGITLTLAERPFPKAKREYDGLELTLDKRFANNWMLRASYTYSELYGNYSGLASSDENGRTSPNVNRFFDHIENSYNANGDLVYGPLGTDRPHSFKSQLLYRFPFKLSVGWNQYIASGIPVSQEGRVPINIPFFPYGRNDLGRTPTVTQSDIALYQDFKIGAFNLQLGLNVMNLFDEDTEMRRDNVRQNQDLPLTTEEFFAGGWDYEQLVKTVTPNPFYNMTNQFQGRRELRFSVKLEF